MHRKINISKCNTYILAYVIANVILSNAQFTTNETDQSAAAVQTEKIMNVYDVSETTNRTAPSSTVDFMNERPTENGNDNNDTTIASTKSIDDRTAKIVDIINAKFAERNADNNTKPESFSQDFNLDDLEDLNYHKKDTFEDGDAEDVVTETTHRFEELTLEEVTSANSGKNIVLDDKPQNVYRVAKSKLKSNANVFISNNSAPLINGSVLRFRMFTEMYDQYRWNIQSIMTNVSSKCGLDMQIYLNALHKEVEWALKGNCYIHKLFKFQLSLCFSYRFAIILKKQDDLHLCL